MSYLGDKNAPYETDSCVCVCPSFSRGEGLQQKFNNLLAKGRLKLYDAVLGVWATR